MENQACKGMRDLLPEDVLRFRYIESVFRTCCLDWGYEEVRTPTLEYLHLFTATGTLTPSMLGKVYSFLDWNGWSGERVVLRPDGTIPVVRLYISHLSEQEIARLFYVTNIFAFEETGGENRERWQCGVEFLGSAETGADVEIILLARELLQKLGFGKLELQLSHAGLVRALIKELGLNSSEEAEIMSRILDGDWQALAEVKSVNPELGSLFSLLLNLKGKSSGFLHNAKALLPSQASPALRRSLEDFINIATLLDSLNCDYQIDIKVVRGFEYYTGVCFGLLADEKKIGGGGRYDNLVPLMGGKNTPARGFALYLDPIVKLLPSPGEGAEETRILIRAEGSTSNLIGTCFRLAQSLHEAGYKAVLDFTARGEFDYRWTILVSEKEPSPFTVIDNRQKQQQNADSADEILAVLRG
jgi:histidyl-tRNA synthetase